MIVFYEPIDRLFHRVNEEASPMSAGIIWVLIALVIMSVIVIETRFSDKGKFVRPSLLTAVAFAISTVITFYISNTIAALLSFTLSFMILIVLYDKKTRPFPALILGAIIGVIVTTLAFILMNLL
ncbi:hypothetical protein D3C71_1739090 [compost metagenome]